MGKQTIPTRCLFLALLCVEPAAAQHQASSFWLRIWSFRGAHQSMEFGSTDANTFGIDSLVPVELREYEPPDYTSTTFDCVWSWPPGHAGAWGSWRGLYPRDYRAFPSPTGVDTFVLDFAYFEILNDTLALKWPDPSYLHDRCDSLVLLDPYAQLGLQNDRLNMFDTDTLMVPDPAGLPGPFPLRLWIVRSGVRIPTTASEMPGVAPADIELLGNYPNPFNPVTHVVVRNPSRGLVALKIYDILGRVTASLFEGSLEPGWHEFTWDARDAAAGVYMARLITPARGSSRALILAH